jgi:nucleoside-diphosphate-sugar epimerase
MSDKTILITGANGFVGSNLYDALSGEFHLIGLDITGPGKYPSGDFYRWEDMDSLPAVHTIIHLAGKAHDTADTSREQEYFDVNLGLTQKIFDHFLQSGAEKFIFFSSVKAVADTIRGDWLTEENEPDPQTPYGKSKLAAEQYILKRLKDFETERPGDEGARERRRERAQERNNDNDDNHDNHDNNPIPNAPFPEFQSPIISPFAIGDKIRNSRLIYILRPAMIHGPGNKGNLNLLYKIVSKGIPWPLGSFENKRSFASIGNVAYVVRLMIERNIPSGIYNLADDESLSTNAIIGMIADCLHRKTSIWHIPPGLVRATARTGDLLHLPFNSERLKKLTENYCVSNALLRQIIRIEKLPVSAQEGMAFTLQSFRKIR